ncbi:hypothetical protein [uncultured Arsenicicoccus sp.]|uniref:hypothetical protein n=1 Tax=uncultured Arsenicicoccus sp. TaxID=491339 RepID=UPI00259AE9C1|nr:hypothetical protein [uncultured Arsenicicoccus sp.]
MSDDDQNPHVTDQTTQPDQGPFHDVDPTGAGQSADERPAYPDADQDTGVDDQGGYEGGVPAGQQPTEQVPEPTSGDPETPGESDEEGNAEGLTQGINAG